MALEMKISKTDWEKLTPAVQELYDEQEDGVFVLPVKGDGREDVGPLKRALERVKADLEAERASRKEAEGKLDELDTVDARKRGDIDKLTQQWEKKVAEQEEAAQARVNKLQDYIRETAIDGVVNTVASRNTGSKEHAELLDPHLRSKLSVEFGEDGSPQVLMATEDGSAPLDLEAFEKSVVDNPAYKSIIVENRASGGGAADEDTGHGGSAFQTGNHGQQTSDEPDLSSVDPDQLVKLLPKK